MVSTGISAWIPHTVLLLGLGLVLFPVFVAFVATSLPLQDILDAPMTLVPGPDLLANHRDALAFGTALTNGQPVAAMMLDSLVMALAIAIGKIAISLPSAYAVVFFRFPLRRLCFWAIFVTLMLPVEVWIIPTYEIAADLGLIDTYPGLVVPLIASATATLLFRQFFLTIPDELVEAPKIRRRRTLACPDPHGHPAVADKHCGIAMIGLVPKSRPCEGRGAAPRR
jgi:sn-glycerol 3-phosphate transport system permease protein